MTRVKINKDRCKGCKLCLIVCPKKTFSVSDNLNIRGVNPVFVSNKECSGCGFCMLVCPDMCIVIKR